MNLREIKELIRLVDASGLTEFNYEEENIKLTLKKEIILQQINTSKQNNIIDQTVTKTVEVALETHTASVDENLHIIKSPIVGIFYASPNPESPVFVKPGDRVKSGQVLCIVEAMKLMNEITSDVDGELVDVLVANQGTVEYGQPLFKIRKA